jgi:hypothetical protein
MTQVMHIQTIETCETITNKAGNLGEEKNQTSNPGIYVQM